MKDSIDKEFGKMRKNAGKIIFSLIFALIIFYILLRSVDVEEMIKIIRNIRIRFFILAFSLFYLSFLIRALRWRILLKNAGINASIGKSARIMLISWLFNSIFPAKIGDFYRGYAFKDLGAVSKSLGTVFAERIMDAVAIVSLFFVSGFFASEKIEISGNFIRIAFFIVILIAILITLIFFYAEKAARLMPAGFKNLLIEFKKGSRESFKTQRLLLISFATLLIWLLDATRLFFVARALNISIPFSLAFLVIIVGSLLTAFPLSSGGLGAVEAGIAGLLIIFGLGREAAVSIALLERLISYWSLIFTGSIAYAWR